MPKIKVLHIANWYPNKDKIHEGNFIKNHIDALEGKCDNEFIHIQVKPGKDFLTVDKTSQALIIYTRFYKYYKAQELLTFHALIYFLLFKQKARGVDVINFHIATPLGRYLNFINFFLRKKIIITEHWTAYRHFFYLPKNHKGLKRMKRIFFKKIKLIVVSKQLGEDIKAFSDNANLNYDVVPNVVDTDIFNYQPKKDGGVPKLFMATNWSPEKRPMPILFALSELGIDFELNIAGDGVLLAKMKEVVAQLKLTEKVNFIGRVEPEALAHYMQEATLFLHEANYETFSLVCAEALCCGCPVMAPNIPAIAAYLKPEYGVIVETFDTELSFKDQTTIWLDALKAFLSRNENNNRKQCADYYNALFSKEVVGEKYFSVIKNWADEK